jgi:hypothetical protein
MEGKYDGEDNTIAMENGGNKYVPPPSARGINLDLNFAESKSGGGTGGQSKENVQEGDIFVIFELPDGSQGESTFKLGHTVEFLKSFVQSEYGILMQDQKLFIEGKTMIDPMSLNDYPETSGTCHVGM